MVEQSLILGIDLGTTSIKICVLDSISREIVYEASKCSYADTQTSLLVLRNQGTPPSTSDFPHQLLQTFSEQDVWKIWTTLNNLVSLIEQPVAARISAIGICGQQHGCVMWNSTACRNLMFSESAPGFRDLSTLVTWEDQRCSDKFLSGLPRPNPEQVLATGYGNCTMFWYVKHFPDVFETYDMSGNVMDFIVWLLCDLPVPVMSPQNAEAWGYFDRSNNSWNEEMLKSHSFPTRLLPEVRSLDKLFAGQLKMSWNNITTGIPISVGLGDLQCSFIASLENKTDAILNFSTSSQLSFVRAKSDQLSVPSSCDIRSYFNGEDLLTAPSLNGGNILRVLVQFLIKFMESLGLTVGEDEIWASVVSAANAANNWTTDGSPVIRPTMFGERYDTGCRGALEQLRPDNCNMGGIVRGILKGVILNLRNMLPLELVKSSGIKRIMLTGSLFKTFPPLIDFASEVFQLPVAVKTGGKDAAFGAALAVIGK